MPPVKNTTKLLVPGAGLCRLAHECAMRGYAVEAVDSSLLMILVTHFLLILVMQWHADRRYLSVFCLLQKLSHSFVHVSPRTADCLHCCFARRRSIAVMPDTLMPRLVKVRPQYAGGHNYCGYGIKMSPAIDNQSCCWSGFVCWRR